MRTRRVRGDLWGACGPVGSGAADPSEIGPVIAFVGSRVNTSMTGADVNVDGGADST